MFVATGGCMKGLMFNMSHELDQINCRELTICLHGTHYVPKLIGMFVESGGCMKGLMFNMSHKLDQIT